MRTRQLGDIVRGVLLEDTKFKGFEVGVQATKSARSYSSGSSLRGGEPAGEPAEPEAGSSGPTSPDEVVKLPYDTAPQEDINFYRAVLRGIGAPESDNNLRFMNAWRQAEGGNALFNPFNTTQRAEGATNYNKATVKNYVSEEQGIASTVKTLLYKYYDRIVADMRADSPATKTASNHDQLKVWGTGTLISTVLKGKALKPPPIARAKKAT
jgi:hypothetical protein